MSIGFCFFSTFDSSFKCLRSMIFSRSSHEAALAWLTSCFLFAQVPADVGRLLAFDSLDFFGGGEKRTYLSEF